MTQITPQIWIGSSRSASTAGLLDVHGIRNILNCAVDLPPELTWRGGFKHYHVGLVDGDGNHPALYAAAVSVLDAITADPGAKVLVHCHEGGSRSVFVVACHLVRKQMHPDVISAIEFIRKCGRDCFVKNAHIAAFSPQSKLASQASHSQDCEFQFPTK